MNSNNLTCRGGILVAGTNVATATVLMPTSAARTNAETTVAAATGIAISSAAATDANGTAAEAAATAATIRHRGIASQFRLQS